MNIRYTLKILTIVSLFIGSSLFAMELTNETDSPKSIVRFNNIMIKNQRIETDVTDEFITITKNSNIEFTSPEISTRGHQVLVKAEGVLNQGSLEVNFLLEQRKVYPLRNEQTLGKFIWNVEVPQEESKGSVRLQIKSHAKDVDCRFFFIEIYSKPIKRIPQPILLTLALAEPPPIWWPIKWFNWFSSLWKIYK